MVVPDTEVDPRFADNPLVTGEPNIRFYAGAPLCTSDGYRLGTLCAVDSTPRELSDEQLKALRDLGDLVMQLLETRLTGIRAREDRERSKHIEAQLIESQVQYRNLVNGSLQGIYVIRDHKLVFANQALAEMAGYDGVDQMLSADGLEHFLPLRERGGMREYLDGSSRDGTGGTISEFRAHRKDGTVIDLVRRVHLTTWEGKRALQGTVIDVTEQKHAQLMLEQQRDMLQALADNLPEFVNIKGTDGRFQFVNKRFEEWVAWRVRTWPVNRSMTSIRANRQLCSRPRTARHWIAGKSSRTRSSCFIPMEKPATWSAPDSR
jgi:PAS domain S-box-containing protein